MVSGVGTVSDRSTASGSPAVGSAPEETIAAGEVLAGRYRIARLLGCGAMGEVYEALDLELHERVALKRIRPGLASSPAAIERFKREVHLARRITHPNVC